jgi:hypothetical protein
MLRRTYVETGVFPQLNNANNQILYGRRGTGKSHVLRILEVEASQAGTCTVYIDVRVLGSAQMMADDTRPLVVRYVSVFKDLVFLIQGELMDIATDPNRDGNGMEEVSDLADAIAEKNVQITRREIELARESRDSSIVKGAARLSPTPSMNSVEEAARDWFETDKSTTLAPELRDALNRIVTNVIGTRQSTMFMLAREHANHSGIQALFDMRLIHLISRGYSDKENPGLRYNIYSLDYGTYVDLKRTKSQPVGFETTFDGGVATDRIVPFPDKKPMAPGGAARRWVKLGRRCRSPSPVSLGALWCLKTRMAWESVPGTPGCRLRARVSVS